MFNYFCSLSPIVQAFLGGCFTWFITSLGAGIVFFIRKENDKLMKCLSGFAGGIMLAAAFWSLLNPAVEISEEVGLNSPLILSSGFLLGVLLLIGFDYFCKKIYERKDNNYYKRSWLVILSITLHNIPEGLIVGVAFGSVVNGIGNYGIIEALLLTLSIAIQNFPEGCSISLPLRRNGYSNKKSFLIGQASALVEPISAVLGALLVMKIQLILPFLLAFAAGAMIFVVVSELVPDMNDKGYLTTFIFIIGFILMMVLDIGIK